MAIAGAQVPFLSYGVFGLGVVLCLISMALLFLGKRAPGAGDGPQVIKLGSAEFSLNSAVTLFVVSALVAVLPLALIFYAERSASAPASRPAPKEEAAVPVPLRNVINVNGYIQDRQGHTLRGVTVSAYSGGAPLHQESTTLGDGAFDLTIPLTHEGQSVRLVGRKGSYEQEIGILRGPAVVTFTKVVFAEQ